MGKNWSKKVRFLPAYSALLQHGHPLQQRPEYESILGQGVQCSDDYTH